ncbi:MAG: FmdE family protein [Anaerovoracaceae bacterium]|jgi:formylmethanofuran dehydrogenase subunit E
MNQREEQLWQECIAFHGHECGGLLIGFKAAVYILQLFGMERSGDEELICISENDSCGIDGIQYVAGCTLGKGNLLLRLRGKQAYNFYSREQNRSVRLLLREPKIPKEEMREMSGEEIFTTGPAAFELPEPARIFRSCPCEECGEMTADYFLRFQNGKRVCPACFHRYDRFL